MSISGTIALEATDDELVERLLKEEKPAVVQMIRTKARFVIVLTNTTKKLLRCVHFILPKISFIASMELDQLRK